MNGVDYYARLLRDPDRIDAFRAAIQEMVTPDSRVLDLGTGLGTYAFFAARAGAREVWGVDREPILHLAETLARVNGFGDELRLLRGRVPGTPLPGEVDLLLFEDFPVALLDRPTWELLRAVAPHLAPEARMLPGAARLALAPAGSDRLVEALFPLAGEGGGGEEGGGIRRYGLEWGPLTPFLAGTPRRVFAREEELLGAPARGPRLDLLPPPSPEALGVVGEWEVASPGRVDALLLWFDMEVGPGRWLSNAPGDRTQPWGQWALPVHPPLEVGSGAVLHAWVQREPAPGSGAPGWARWELRAGDEVRRGHEFQGLLLGPQDLVAQEDGGHRWIPPEEENP